MGSFACVGDPWMLEPDGMALGDAMRWVTEHPEEARQRGATARRLVATDWIWERAVAELRGRLGEVLGLGSWALGAGTAPRAARLWAEPAALPGKAHGRKHDVHEALAEQLHEHLLAEKGDDVVAFEAFDMQAGQQLGAGLIGEKTDHNAEFLGQPDGIPDRGEMLHERDAEDDLVHRPLFENGLQVLERADDGMTALERRA